MAELCLPSPPKGAAANRLRGAVLGGRFELLELLDEGGMACVYVGRDRVSGEHVAVKVLRHRLAQSAEIRQRFFHEARATMGMRSRHVVEIVDVGSAGDEHVYFAMELLDGLRLDELCGEPLPIDLIYDYARQIAAALQVAHAKGVVHRDLKPDNIFVERIDGEDVVKLIDFGIAKHQTASTLTVPGAVFGTPHYMAPEQAAGRNQVGPQADIYAVGIVLYELTTGELPFDGMDAMQVMLAQIGLPPPSIRERRRDCPPELEAIILRCLQKRPDDRYHSAAALRDALDRVAGDAPTAAECRTLGDDVSGLRLRPALRDEGPEIETRALGAELDLGRTVLIDHDTASIDVADLVGFDPLELDDDEPPGRPTPTEPTPWVRPRAQSAEVRHEWLFVLAVAVSVGVTLLVAHLLGAAFV